MLSCPKCGSKVYVLETRRDKNDCVRRRYGCTLESCRHRWTDINGPPPPKSKQRFLIENPLTENAIHDILVSPGTHSTLAKKYGKSASAIGKIRRGELYGNIFPEIPRSKPLASAKASCYKCLHCVDKQCKLGWPDLEEDGPLAAAKYCNDYEPE